MNKQVNTAVLGCAVICALGLNPVLASTTATARIVGGYTQNISNTPWQVAIGTFGVDTYFGQYCGASILNDIWILTAAHCFFETDGSPTTDELIVTIGESALSTASPTNQYRFTVADNVHIHPDYNTSGFDNDIALIQLPSPMDLATCGNKCEAIELVTPANEGTTAHPSANAWVSGWGGTTRYTPDSEGLPPEGFQQTFDDTLKELEVSILTCEGTLGTDYTENTICAGASDLFLEDSCQGDSGGPLSVANNDGTGFLLAGIVSYGHGCAAGFSGAYTRVSKYNDWINTRFSNPNVAPGNTGSSNGPVPAAAKSGGGATGFPLLVLLLGLAVFRARVRRCELVLN